MILFSQSSNQNYVLSRVYKTPTETSNGSFEPSEVKVNVTYFDGLGRPIQKIANKQANNGKDISTHIEYDELGRQQKEFLPFVNDLDDTSYIPDALDKTIGFYNTSSYEYTTNPYSQKFFDNSPLNRVIKQAAPGLSWQGSQSSDDDHTIKFQYDVNQNNEVKKFRAVTVWNSAFGKYNSTLLSDGYYKSGSLYKTVTKDENWTEGNKNTITEYKDNLGRVILKRTFLNEPIDTYYVYDEIGNLSFVIPPLASDNITSIQTSSIPYVYSQSINILDLMLDNIGNPLTGGGGGISISIQNSSISVQFNGAWNGNAYIDTSKSYAINAVYPIPNMTIGNLWFYYNGNNKYRVYIEDNKLKFSSLAPNEPPFMFGRFDGQTLTQSLPSATFATQIVYNSTINNSVISNLCYQYIYDGKNRLVEKKLPGKQWEFIVYDKLDRVVATGPAYSPFVDQQIPSPKVAPIGWLITKYDCFNRTVYTGWTLASSINTTQRNSFQTTLNSRTTFSETKTTSGTIDGIPAFYTNVIPIVTGTFKLLTVSYYDDYTFPNPPVIPTTVAGSQSVYYNNSTRKPKGMPTGSWERVLQNQNNNNGLRSYTLYDNKSRPVKSSTANYLGGYTEVESKIDFSGKTLLTITRHKRIANDAEIRTDEVFTYSAQDRLLTHTHQINGGTVQLLTANTYNEMGQLRSKNVGGTTINGSSGLQKIDYTYNIRGWLTGINDTRDLLDSGAAANDLFAFKINYNTLDNNQTDVIKLYNGNISETRWRTNFDNLTRSYGYSYDALNRLTNAQYVRPSNPSNPNPADIVNTFNEKLTYDKNGNIQTVVRNGGMESQTTVPIMDNLTYGYDSNTKNKLIKVTDATANTDGFNDGANTTEEYGYDPNGNMTRDDNKNIRSIVYNHLNLPTKIVFQRGAHYPSISYLYTATGEKIAKTVDIASRNRIIYTVDYLDGYQYESGMLLFFPTAEGYVKYTEGVSNPFDYVFNYTDHLGNIRLSYGINPGTGLLTKIEENNYYPFGLKHATYNNMAKVIAKVENAAEVAAVSGKFMVQKIDVLAALLARPPVELPPGEIIEPEIYSGYNYKYNSKELQDELGLNTTAMDFRQYDNALGRFNSIDKLASMKYDSSPYRFAFNNPNFWVDPSGLFETRREAREYRREHHISGSISKGDDGTFSINDKKNNTSYFKPEAGLELSTTGSDGVATAPLVSSEPTQSNVVSNGKAANDYAGFVATGLETAPGSFRLSTNLQGFSPKFYPSGWFGNQFATTYALSKIGKGLGFAGVGIGITFDAVGVANYYNPQYGPKSPNSVHPAKMGVNLGMVAYGYFVTPLPSLLYSGIDMFYPGGWTGDDKNPGLAKDQERLNNENKAINPEWQLWPGAMKQ